jgi:dTDP-glucose 4,6-dehydratase
MLYKQTYGIHVIIARCFAFIGRDLPLDAHFAIGNFIYDAINSKQITVKNNGDPIRTYMDQRDLAVWLNKILFEGENGEAYNIGSDIAISIKELAYLVRDIISPNKEVIFLKQKESKRRNIYIPSIKKMEEKFNIKCKYNLEQSIKEFKI